MSGGRAVPTVEWQVQGACNYDCSYCIQSKKHRRGAPTESVLGAVLDGLCSLPGVWEIKMSGGEPFAGRRFLDVVIPRLAASRHAISVLTNLSAPDDDLMRFARLTWSKLRVASVSMHLEHTTVGEFARKALRLRDAMDPNGALVVNGVLVPGRLGEVRRVRDELVARGLKFFPQVMKVKGGIAEYALEERALLDELLGDAPGPREANVAPSYRGRHCLAGVDYFVLTQHGDAYACRTAKRHGEGVLGNLAEGTFARASQGAVCPYSICPCTVPANRGMIAGIGPRASHVQGTAQVRP